MKRDLTPQLKELLWELACEESKRILENEKRQVQQTNQEKSKLDTKETVKLIKVQNGDVLRKLAKS